MENTTKVTTSEKTFTSHVFNFDDETKNRLMNITQYLAIAFIPLVILNHILTKLFSQFGTENQEIKIEKASSIQLLAEIMLELALSLGIAFYVDKFVTYFTPYSGSDHDELNLVNLVFMAVPFKTYTFGSSMGMKTKELLNRFDELVFGDDEENKKPIVHKKNTNVKVSQPISGRPHTAPTHAVSRADYVQQHQNQIPPQESLLNSNNNGMYGGPTTPLVNAQMPSNNTENFENMMPISMEPAAANGVLGGSFGSSF